MTSFPHSHSHHSFLDVSNVKDVSAKWERSNTSPEIYYMCWNQMESAHSSQQRVTAVTPAQHKKQSPLPSMGTGLDWCLQPPTLCAPAAIRFNHPHLALPSSHWPWLFLKLLLLSVLPVVAGGDIKATAGQRRAFLTLALSFISLLHRPVSGNEKISQYR